MKLTSMLPLLLVVASAAACAQSEPPPTTLEEALMREFGASSAQVLLVRPPPHLEVVLSGGDFADASQAEQMETTREVALFVRDRLDPDAEIESIAVELVLRHAEAGPFGSRTALRGEHPLSSL